MKFKTPDHRLRQPLTRDVLNLPETEHSFFPQLEVLFEEDRENVAGSVERNILDSTDPTHQFALTDLARTIGATLILEQAFKRPVLSPELRHRALAALHSQPMIDLFKERLPGAGFDLQMLWFQAAIAHFFPEDRPKLGITNEVFNEWLDRFSNFDDQLTFEDKPVALSYLVQLRPDQLTRCRQILNMTGYNQQHLGEEIWSFKHELLEHYREPKAKSLANVRLLQPERSLTGDQKQLLLATFGKRTRYRGFRGSADEYANIALLLAPQVSIGPDGKVLLQQPAPTQSSPDLPLRPEV